MKILSMKKAVKLYGMTEDEILALVHESIHPNRCSECGAISDAEPDASEYDCEECDAEGTVNAIMIELGMM